MYQLSSTYMNNLKTSLGWQKKETSIVSMVLDQRMEKNRWSSGWTGLAELFICVNESGLKLSENFEFPRKSC